MKANTLPIVILAVLGLGGCERNRDGDRTGIDEAATPAPGSALDDRSPAERSPSVQSREIAEQGARSPDASPSLPGGPEAPAGIATPKVDPSPYHDEHHHPGGDPGMQTEQTRADFVAASRSRLAELERELQELETRSRQRGKDLRTEIRKEKRQLDADLERMDRESEEAWSQMKQGFADALGRLEVQIRKVREDIDGSS
jgi:hypothetical protein